MLRELKKANATFDSVVANAVKHFPDSIIHVRRGPWFFIDNIAVTITIRKGPPDPAGAQGWNKT